MERRMPCTAPADAEVGVDELILPGAGLHEAGLGKSGEGDRARLAKSGLLQSVDPAYLQTHGFGQAGGGAFTLDEGLRPHLLRHAKQVKKAYDRGT